MKIKRSRKISKQTLYVIITAISLLVVLLGAYLFFFKGNILGWSIYSKPKISSSINYSPPTDDQKKAGDAIKEPSVTNSTKPGSTNSDKASTPEPQSNGKSSISLTITAANKNQLRSLIGTVTNNGTCTLTMSKGSESKTYTAGVQALASESTCRGFDFPAGDLSTGNWLATLHFENDSLQGDTKQNVLVQ
jgi:hypothetical protein